MVKKINLFALTGLGNKALEYLIENGHDVMALYTRNETLEWLNRFDIDVEVAINDKELLGAVILYLNKDAELAIFTKYHRQGVANKLLQSVKLAAKQTYSLEYIWAWVADENEASLSLFLRNGFSVADCITRQYRQIYVEGCVLKCIV